MTWPAADAAELQTEIGAASGQTSWELLAILISLSIWGTRHRGQVLAILGDNLAALEAALHLKGRNALSKIGRELAWRRARAGWRYAVGHLPAERNVIADALSRLAAPKDAAKPMPIELGTASRVEPPDNTSLWVL